MKKLITLFLGIILLATPLVFADEQTPDNAPTQNPAMLLDQTANEIRNILHEMHESLEVAKDELSAAGIQGEKATAALQKLYEDNKHAFDCATINPDGVIVNVAPKEMSYILGMDISHQEQIKRLKKTHEPVVSTAIDTVEKGLLGLNGRIIYDTNPEEIGKNLFTDKLYMNYPSLIAVGREMAKSVEGQSHYMFLDKEFRETVRKELIWTTIELHGTEFRLALAYLKKDP